MLSKLINCVLLLFVLIGYTKAQEYVLRDKEYDGKIILGKESRYEFFLQRGMFSFESKGFYEFSKDHKQVLLTSTHQKDSVSYIYEEGAKDTLNVFLFGFEEIPIYAKIIVDDSLESSTIKGHCKFNVSTWNKFEIIPDYPKWTYDTLRVYNNGCNTIKIQTLNSLIIPENYVFLKNASFKYKKKKIIDNNHSILGERRLVFVIK